MFGHTFWTIMPKIGPAMPIILIVLFIIVIYIVLVFIIGILERRKNNLKDEKKPFRFDEEKNKPFKKQKPQSPKQEIKVQTPPPEIKKQEPKIQPEPINIRKPYVKPQPKLESDQTPQPTTEPKQEEIKQPQQLDMFEADNAPLPINPNATDPQIIAEQYRRGTNAYAKENFTLAFTFFQRAAQGGNINAQHSLGAMYDKGLGVKQNYLEAIKWYTAAAENGHEFAQYSLGCKYQEGEGVQADMQEAAKWYQKAAQQGSEEARKALERINN